MKRNKNVTGLMLDPQLEFTAIIIFVNILMSYGVDSTEPTGETVSPPHSLGACVHRTESVDTVS